MAILILNEKEIRNCITMQEAIPVIEKAFEAYSNRQAALPSVIHLDVPDQQGEVHIKAGYIYGSSEFVLKAASGFWENRKRNLPVSGGLMVVFDSITGFPAGILVDNCYLTELRTGAAGAVAAKHMSSNNVEQVALIGAGSQGRFQLEALRCVRSFQCVRIYDHHAENTERYISQMKDRIPARLEFADTPEEALKGSRIVITTTPSRVPVLHGSWLEPGMHITAMGSDGAGKQELDVSVLERADRIIADSISQCVKIGEIHSAIEAGILREEEIDGELGEVVAKRIPGRLNEGEITICDLTGVGVQDAAIAGLVYRKALAEKIGTIV